MTGSSKPKNKMLMLLKNDFLASSRVISLFYIAEVIALALFFIGKKFSIDKLYAVAAVATAFIPLLLIFVTLFFVVYDFNKALFSQQGYLSFSLPVSSNQLLGSKMIVYGGWMFVSFAVTLAVLGYIAALAEGNEKVQLADIALAMLGLPSVAHIKVLALCYIFDFFVSVFSMVSMVYFAITLSHVRTFQKAPVFWSVIIFLINFALIIAFIGACNKVFCINILIPSTELSGVKLYLSNIDPEDGSTLISLLTIICFILQDIVLFFATSYLMHKKINIK